MSGRSEFAEGLGKAAREAYDDVFNMKPLSKRKARTEAIRSGLDPVKKVLRQRGYSWPSFVEKRASVDPNLSKLTKKQRNERIISLFEELGEDGFIKRFNL